MNKILRLFMIAVATVTAIPSFAVTDKEMEAARVLAAKHYLRLANNGSDYLDKLEPQSMAELNAALKAKEKENIKAFNAVAVPKDYASWDKAKLVEYWGTTFFKQPGLSDDGKKMLGTLRSRLGKLNVAAATPKAETPAPAEKTEPAETPVQPQPATAEPETPVSAVDADLQADSIAAIADADAGLADEAPKKSSHTGWYIAILVVLVGVVVWLVVYAARTMKGGDTALLSREDTDREVREAKRAAKEEQTSMREKYAASVAGKNDEIKQLKARCEELETKLEEAQREADKAKRQAATLQREMQQLEAAAGSRRSKAAEPQPETPSNYRSSSSAQQGLPPVVWMGIVNQRGLFTKASRSVNPESSVYRMDIPDGRHGTFMVAGDDAVVDRVLSDPEKWLAGGCVIENPEDADIAAEIVTTAAGEALFADNTCKVTKKARVKFL